jgi:uncharacterized protein YceH (UPF0502 family)
MKLRDWGLIFVGGLVLFGCERRMSSDQLDATRANAGSAVARVWALEKRVGRLEARIDELEAKSSK